MVLFGFDSSLFETKTDNQYGAKYVEGYLLLNCDEFVIINSAHKVVVLQ